MLGFQLPFSGDGESDGDDDADADCNNLFYMNNKHLSCPLHVHLHSPMVGFVALK